MATYSGFRSTANHQGTAEAQPHWFRAAGSPRGSPSVAPTRARETLPPGGWVGVLINIMLRPHASHTPPTLLWDPPLVVRTHVCVCFLGCDNLVLGLASRCIWSAVASCLAAAPREGLVAPYGVTKGPVGVL